MLQSRNLPAAGAINRRSFAGVRYHVKHQPRVVVNAQTETRSVPFIISVKKQVEYGESVKAVGNQPSLGAWDPSQALDLKWGDGHVWSATTTVPVGVEVCFKLVRVKGSHQAQWEDGQDRKFKALGADHGLRVQCNWGDTGSVKVDSFKLDSNGQGIPASGSNGVEPFAPIQTPSNNSKGRSMARDSSPAPSSSNGDSSSKSLSSFEEEARSTGSWVGAQPEFVRSRKDRGGRQGTWRTEGLQGAQLDVVRGDQEASNWLGKLGVLKSVLVDRPQMMRPQLDELSAGYVYATWINTGAITCVETGGHHRPNHHATLALEMFRSLEWSIGDASASGTTYGPSASTSSASPGHTVLAARRMHTRLPSISGEFRVSTPLTRIRDIAHRNDIPKDLKDEIKHTLQNKLHRSAGPEDLVATEAMLQRITAVPGQYSSAFVEEFKAFVRELREFFNATGLVDLLNATLPSLDDSHASTVKMFLAAMQRLDESSNGKEPKMDDLLRVLMMGTQVRTYYAAGLSAGLRNDASDEALAMRQRWRLAEIRTEDYCFVLLSRIINALEQAGGASTLSRANNAFWSAPLAALTSGLRHLGLSAFRPKELMAVENELMAWHAAAPLVEKRESAMRAKATVERALRLASDYSDAVMDVYSSTAASLGNALGVQEHMARVFGESEVRASMAFQVSKLAALMVKGLRVAAGVDAWDGLVTGEAVGRLVECDALTPEVMAKTGNDDVVLLVRRADGDEEVGPLGPRLRGVVLLQELPHLSHLGVRARQEKVPFATCDDADYVAANVRPLVGQWVRMEVTASGVTLARAQPQQQQQQPKAAQPQQKKAAPAASGGGPAASTQRATRLTVVPLEGATQATCGAKAAKCADLEKIAASSKGLFSTPPGCALPYGCMELAIEAAGVTDKYQALLAELGRAELTGSELDATCGAMQQLVEGLTLPDGLVSQIRAPFASAALLAVRSSANVEDLSGMSAAGLYESKVGVPADDPAAVSAAVAAVWASLYTRRAVMSRRAAGVAQGDACMAVLIQELRAPDVSFVLHTARPSDSNTGVVMAELAPGQGETLASGTRGTPWRLEVVKSNGQVSTLAFANFSHALVLPPSKAQPQVPGARGLLVEAEVDYSRQRMSVDSDFKEQVARQLSDVGVAIESAYGGAAQDIEGGLMMGGQAPDAKPTVFIFQTRPQF